MRLKNTYLAALLAVSICSPAVAQSNETTAADLSKDPTLYVVGYAHLDTEWRWEYPQVINEYIRNTMERNFDLFEKYPHYVFNFSGANRYRFMKEYFPEDYAKVKKYVSEGRWFPAGSSMEEGDVNAPNAEAIIRQVLYGNKWFKKEFGKASAEYMLPDCFGFPSSLPTILAHSGVKGFSTQKLTWGSSADGGGLESVERTPEGTPFNVGAWVGPDGESVLAGVNPGSYGGGVETDLSQPLPAEKPNATAADLQNKITEMQQKFVQARQNNKPIDPQDIQRLREMRNQLEGIGDQQKESDLRHFQYDWAARVKQNGEKTGVLTDYHYYGTGDIGGSPDEDSVKRLEAIVTKGSASFPPEGALVDRRKSHPDWPSVNVGNGPVHVVSARADQMFLDITPEQANRLPRYTGEMELTNHSAGSLTSQAYQKRWIRKAELLADAAEKSSIAAEWLGGRPYPMQRLNDAWTLAMGAHFHDLAAGTATPRSYEFAWNDDVIALNQFAAVFADGAKATASALDTRTEGTPIVVFNQLNVSRDDLVEAEAADLGKLPEHVSVVGPDGRETQAQVSNGKLIFVASAPSAGYAVYDVRSGSESGRASGLTVSQSALENEYYSVQINGDGDVSSIYDKSLGKELLTAPVRMAISYDNPEQWPAWNMDWDQEQAPAKEFVHGPAQIRVVENGPARVAVEVARDTAGSHFVQTVRLAAGDAGKRVEFSNVVDWKTRESNLKAVFALSASNEKATYNWDIGTIERPTAQPKKFEVPSHQWIDLTDMSGAFGATILTDCKNGSDKPNDHTIRLTLIRTPGMKGGYPDQATQDIGHHEFVFGIAGHADGWREGQTDWQGQRLNASLIAFATDKHEGALGKSFSLLKVNDPRIRVLALKKAEDSDEIVVRLVELDGKPHKDVRITFASTVTAAREMNGQEEEVGPAKISDGALVTSFGAYQPRTFAVKVAPAPAKATAVHSVPVALKFDTAIATKAGEHSDKGFDGQGHAFAAEMMPSEVVFDGATFRLGNASGSNAIIAKGQKLALPEGHFTRVYVLAASIGGDRKATFDVGGKKAELSIEDWGGFIGQWDDRTWSSTKLDVSGANYGQMTGLKEGFIKRADLAWYCDHQHDAAGTNLPYSYSYLFAYPIDVPAGAKTIQLPQDDKVRIFAISAVEDGPALTPAQPLYDVLPSPLSRPESALYGTMKAGAAGN